MIKLVRNPNWDASTDYKPAYLDSITIKEGNDPTVASRQVLEGSHMLTGDFQLPAPILSSVSQGDQKDQLVLTPPTGRFRYIALKNTTKPFDDLNVRKALSAAFDRDALRKAFGGPLVGDIPTHWIPPGQPGFDEAGGEAGPGVDFLAKPEGDLDLAMEYMKKAGYASGKYDGGKTFTGVSDNATQQKQVSETAVAQFAKLGFKVDMKYVTRDSMYTKYCQVPANQPDVCPSVGWLKDFADPETLLGPVFNGKNILEQGNSNFALLEQPEDQRGHGQGRGGQRSRRAQQGVGRDRQDDHRGRREHPVAVGQAAAAQGLRHQRRHQPGERRLGHDVHVGQVGDVTPPSRTGSVRGGGGRPSSTRGSSRRASAAAGA